MIYTCENCHSAFEANILPRSCPDFGKVVITRKIIAGRTRTTPAVRDATAEEEWYDMARRTLEKDWWLAKTKARDHPRIRGENLLRRVMMVG